MKNPDHDPPSKSETPSGANPAALQQGKNNTERSSDSSAPPACFNEKNRLVELSLRALGDGLGMQRPIDLKLAGFDRLVNIGQALNAVIAELPEVQP